MNVCNLVRRVVNFFTVYVELLQLQVGWKLMRCIVWTRRLSLVCYRISFVLHVRWDLIELPSLSFHEGQQCHVFLLKVVLERQEVCCCESLLIQLDQGVLMTLVKVTNLWFERLNVGLVRSP